MTLTLWHRVISAPALIDIKSVLRKALLHHLLPTSSLLRSLDAPVANAAGIELWIEVCSISWKSRLYLLKPMRDDLKGHHDRFR